MSEERSEALRDCFSEVGFERDDLKTVGFNVNTKYENRRDGGSGDYVRVFAGYEFVHELRIEFDAEREKLSCVLGALSRCSAVPEFRLEYSVRDREAAKARLLDLAVADSRTKSRTARKSCGHQGRAFGADDRLCGRGARAFRPPRRKHDARQMLRRH